MDWSSSPTQQTLWFPCASSRSQRYCATFVSWILVHQDVGEPAVILLENVRVLHEKPMFSEKQIAEVDGVQLLQPLLIGRIQLDAAPSSRS